MNNPDYLASKSDIEFDIIPSPWSFPGLEKVDKVVAGSYPHSRPTLTHRNRPRSFICTPMIQRATQTSVVNYAAENTIEQVVMHRDHTEYIHSVEHKDRIINRTSIKPEYRDRIVKVRTHDKLAPIESTRDQVNEPILHSRIENNIMTRVPDRQTRLEEVNRQSMPRNEVVNEPHHARQESNTTDSSGVLMNMLIDAKVQHNREVAKIQDDHHRDIKELKKDFRRIIRR